MQREKPSALPSLLQRAKAERAADVGQKTQPPPPNLRLPHLQLLDEQPDGGGIPLLASPPAAVSWCCPDCAHC